MSLNFKSEEISLREIVCSKYDQTKAECDLIVPDLKPDIAKILEVCGKSVITQKNTQQDKAYIQGVVHLTVIYLSDTGEIKSILTDLDFSHIIDAKGAESGNHLFAESEIESIDYSIVNSRKLSLKVQIGIDTKICRSQTASLITEIPKDCHINAKYKDYSFSCSSLEEEQDFRVKDAIELPSGKADIREILKISPRISANDLRYENGVINLSGDILLCILYSSDEGALCSVEETLPFNETLEGMTLPQGECEASYNIKEINFDIPEAPDGSHRTIDLDILIEGCFKTCLSLSSRAVCDAFGTDAPIKLTKKTYEIENILDKSTTQIAHKETVAVPDYLPEIHKICDCSGSARATGISLEKGRINIDGEILTNVLYSALEDSSPISGFSHISSFSQSVDMPCIDENSICEAKVELDHIGYSINSDRSIELRFIVILTVTALSCSSFETVCHMEICPETEEFTQSPVIIYFPDEGETLWDIAKRYRIAPETITRDNNLDSEILHKGQRLCIFK